METVGILVFEDVEELDFVGPLEVFGMAARFGATCRTLVVAEQRDPVRCRYGLQIMPEYTLDQCPSLDLLIVPGGLGARTHGRQNMRILDFIREQKGMVASVCTGALILAAAGILDGVPATTHHASLDLLREREGVIVQDAVRFAISEHVATSAGISAGIDLALALVSRTWGEGVAAKVAGNLEWHSSEWRAAL